MRDRGLHDGLRDFALDVAALLTEEVRAGGEVPFVIEERGTRPVLYRYAPLTSEFIALRWSTLQRLPSYSRAALAFESRAAPYLRQRGLPGDDPELALRDFLERLNEESTTFEFPEERFEELYGELEDVLSQATLRATVVAPVYGLTLQSRRVELEDGLALLRPSVLSVVPGALAGSARGVDSDRADSGSRATVLCTFEADLASDAPLPLDEARAQFRDLLSGLRLAGAGGVAFSPIAWARAGEGAWHAVPVTFSGETGREPWRLATDDEAELRELLGVMTRSRDRGPAAWALDRFEMGCARVFDGEALTDHLLGLRALLAEDRQDTDMPVRVSALCAAADARLGVQRRVELALEAERAAIAGEESQPPRALAREMEQHLRALLRDVLCGYLDPDLRAAADDIVLAANGPFPGGEEEIRARDIRSEPEPAEADTRELEAIVVGGPEDDDAMALTAAGDEVSPEAAVTPSEDWGFDEDAESYSAPV